MLLKKLNSSFVLQHGQSDCGVACLASVIRYHGGEGTLDHIRQKSGTTKTGTTVLGLCHAAGQLRLDAEGLEAGGIDNLHELDQPAILHVTIEDRLWHYVVFYAFDGDKLLIGDPGKGIERWTREQLESVWKSKALLKLTPGKGFKRAEKKASRYKWIKTWIAEDLNILFAAFFLGLLIAVFNLSTAVFIQKLVDVILPEKELGKLVLGLSLFGILLFVKAGLGYMRGNFLITQSREFNNRMIRFFFGSLIRLPQPFFDSKKSGEMIARMNDTRRIQATVSNLAGNLVIEVLVVLTSLVAILVYSWQAGLLVAALAPLFLLIHFRFNQPILDSQKEVMVAYALNESNYIDMINGIREIKATSSQSLFKRITFGFYEKFQEMIFGLGKVQVSFSMFIELATIVLMLSVIGFSSHLYFQGVMELGVLIAIFSLASSVGPSLTKITLFNFQVQEAKVAFERMQEFTGISPEPEEGTNIAGQKFERLTVENLSFHYPGSLDLLKEVSLEVKKGEMRALLGESGEGKSTLIHLLQRFYTPRTGSILLDGCDIYGFQPDGYRQQVAAVSQETKLFNQSLIFNIALSDNEKEYEGLIRWCEASGFGTYFRKFPQGYLTLLGEEGANISGGQKQLVALARALYRKPSVLLIDEGTSAMDKKTEQFILDMIQHIKKEKAILMVTHRIKVAQQSDYIYVLENGEIVREGTPVELQAFLETI